MVEQGEIVDADLIMAENGFVPHKIIKHEYIPNGLVVEVESANNGLLVLNETYYHGWEATVNGSEAAIYQVNGAFRAVKIPSGKSVVEMRYHPRMLNLGLAISLCSLTLVWALFIWKDD